VIWGKAITQNTETRKHEELENQIDRPGVERCPAGEPGFHIVPEALTIMLLGVGLVGLVGYLGLRRRKGSEINACPDLLRISKGKGR